jgi:hypothetical protein
MLCIRPVLLLLSSAAVSGLAVAPLKSRSLRSPFRLPRTVTAAAATTLPESLAAAAGPAGGSSTGALSAKLLELIENTDRGISASAAARDEIDETILELEASWAGTDAFSSVDLCRLTEVAYVGQKSSAKANAAGGKYRGRVGRLLFQTEALFQHVLMENSVAVNVIQFRLLGLLRGSAVLAGEWSRLEAKELEALSADAVAKCGRALSTNAVTVQFQSPRVGFGRLGRLLNVQFGPPSSVTLDTTYLDDKIRISRGGTSGVPFVFRADRCREGGSLFDAAREWESVVSRKPLGKRSLVAALSLAALGCWRLGSSDRWLQRAVGMAFAVLAGAVARSTGGIVVTRKPTEEPSAASEGVAPSTSTGRQSAWVRAAMAQVEKVKRVRAEKPPTPPAPQDNKMSAAPSRAAAGVPEPSKFNPLKAATQFTLGSSHRTDVTLTDPLFGAPPSGFEWGPLF